MGHIKSECRTRIADEKTAQGGGKNRPHSGAPHAEEEPEPMGASPELIAGCVGLEKDILTDSGAGSQKKGLINMPSMLEVQGLAWSQ